MKRKALALVLGAIFTAPVAAQQVTFMTGPQGGCGFRSVERSRACGRRPFPA